jgi:hypothetical protein
VSTIGIVLPFVFLIVSAGFLVSVVLDKKPKPSPIGWKALFLLIPAGDALLGENRPVWERSWKGAFVVLLAAALLIAWWRGRRRKDAEP